MTIYDDLPEDRWMLPDGTIPRGHGGLRPDANLIDKATPCPACGRLLVDASTQGCLYHKAYLEGRAPKAEYRDRAFAAEAELNEWSAKFGRADPSLVYGALSSALYALGQLGARRPHDDAANEIIKDTTTAILNVLRFRPSLTVIDEVSPYDEAETFALMRPSSTKALGEQIFEHVHTSACISDINWPDCIKPRMVYGKLLDDPGIKITSVTLTYSDGTIDEWTG